MPSYITDRKNTTFNILESNASFVGLPSSGTEKIIIIMYSDTDSATNGHVIQFGQDGIKWDTSIKDTYRGGSEYIKKISTHGKYFRILYINGPIKQTTFRMQVLKYSSTSFYHSVSTYEFDTRIPVYKFGHIKSPPANTWSDVTSWGNYVYDNSNTLMQVSSNNSAETNINISIEGINSSGNLIFEVIKTHSTNGTIPVVGKIPFYRIFKCCVETNPVNTFSNFYISKGGSIPLLGVPLENDKRGELLNNNNQTSMASYTVPKGSHMIVTDIQLSAQKTTTAHVEFMAQIRPMDGSKPWRTIYHTSLTNFSINFSPKLPWVIPGGYDVRARCFPEGTGIFVSAGWNGVVESD